MFIWSHIISAIHYSTFVTGTCASCLIILNTYLHNTAYSVCWTQLCFHKLSRQFWCMLKSERHCSNSLSFSSALNRNLAWSTAININGVLIFKEQEASKDLRILGSTEHNFAFPSNEMHQLEWQILHKHLGLNLHSLTSCLLLLRKSFNLYDSLFPWRALPWASLWCPPALMLWDSKHLNQYVYYYHFSEIPIFFHFMLLLKSISKLLEPIIRIQPS